ncbi:MAG: type III-B CRISPR module-associated Cmr3 family protein [Desulfosoma sp.]|uniref:type III-B CRISPR module-associated Cmr3 family protein n=1 Tax=Desulfosoma sp. TaxID=2603217 RepID=UPI00404A0EFA
MTVLSLTPLDVLMLRGNRLFGGGVHGGALMPPWPSVISGALISRALADRNWIGRVTAKPQEAEELIPQALGDNFSLRSLWVWSGRDQRLWFPAPADVVLLKGSTSEASLQCISPRKVPEGLLCSYPLEQLPVLDVKERRKAAESVWLDVEGWRSHLKGQPPEPSQVTSSAQFWSLNPRLGIALDAETRTVKTGAIYTTDAVSLKADVHLIAVFSGENIPREGLLRLGGDGRAAEVRSADEHIVMALKDIGRPEAHWKAFRMILATPGLFPSGWLPPGVEKDEKDGQFRLRLHDFSATLKAAAVSRYETVSGWDLAHQRPKPAQKVIPVGSCYWFQVEEGNSDVLQQLYEKGLWPLMPDGRVDVRRKREGWNQVWFGVWN